MKPLTLCCLALMFASAAAADDTTPTPAVPATAASPSPSTAAAPADAGAPATDPSKPTPAQTTAVVAEPKTPSSAELVQAATDDPVICKSMNVTGSRVRKTKVCQPRSKWQEATDAAQALHKDTDRKSSPQPGGEQLIGPGR